jgi:hypothetical protein
VVVNVISVCISHNMEVFWVWESQGFSVYCLVLIYLDGDNPRLSGIK